MQSASYRKSIFIFPLFVLFAATFSYAQDIPEIPYFSYGKGLGIASPDSMYLLNIRFRIQNRAAFFSESGSDLSLDEVEARVRRLRLRFDGFVYSKRLMYVIQLSFTRGDMDFDALGFPNVVRDAMILYAVNDRLTLGLGQTKLPGNRQRVNSSGDLQFPDRSIVNAIFNIDRDFGVQAFYNQPVGSMLYIIRTAITTGEGRNFTSTDRGLAYTGRFEWLPFGAFTNNGDYFEGDLEREPSPKVSLGYTFSFNNNAVRTAGQLGTFLFEPRDISTHMMDFLLKYQGYSLSAEWVRRNSPDPVTTNNAGAFQYVYAGEGYNVQTSYLFPNNYELAARYSIVQPFSDIYAFENQTEQLSIGATKYLKGHRVKLQSDLTYQWQQNELGNLTRDQWIWRFQVELGI